MENDVYYDDTEIYGVEFFSPFGGKVIIPYSGKALKERVLSDEKLDSMIKFYEQYGAIGGQMNTGLERVRDIARKDKRNNSEK